MSVAVGLVIRLLGLCGVSLSPFFAGALLVGAASAVLVTGGAVLHHKIYQSGYDAALSDIAEENDAAIARATEKRGVWKECRARNGQWDQSTGSCT